MDQLRTFSNQLTTSLEHVASLKKSIAESEDDKQNTEKDLSQSDEKS